MSEKSNLGAALGSGAHDSNSASVQIGRRSVLLGAAGMATMIGGIGGSFSKAQATGSPIASFAIAVLPDTQFYSRYATTEETQQYQRHYGSTPYAAQTGWIATNAATYSIPFVVHLGDIVDEQWINDQWVIANTAMRQLESAGVPYSVLAGNHDVVLDLDYSSPSDQGSGTDAQRNLGAEPYLQWFPASRAAAQKTFGGRDPSGFHEYHIFTTHGVSFMVLSLSWRISDAALAWANAVIAQNPHLPVILSSHQLLNIDNDAESPLETPYGLMLWDKLICKNDQIFMTLNGHYHGASYLKKYNNFGNEVHEMVVDYQMDYQGGNSLMRLYEFDLTNNSINVMSFSPWVPEKPASTLTQFDYAELTASNQEFSIPIKFHKRFAGFTRFAPSTATIGTPIIQRVRQDFLASYAEPTPAALKLPQNTDDFPLVAETYAHWRAPAAKIGQIAAIGDVLPDVFGGNDFTRALLVNGAQAGDVVWSSDKHALSSAAGSVSFLNTDKTVGRLNAFLTAAGASLNGRSFWSGYTFETFIKIPTDWSATKHAWGNMLGREGNRGNVPGGFCGNDPQASIVLFAISKLREVQWEVVPATDSHYAQTNWSGEIIRGNWYHVAVVNDPSTATTTMYIEGAPVLRNVGNAATGTRSQSPVLPWIFGAGWCNGVLSDGYYGQIGELRIVAKPIGANQWLTARRFS
ncbi:metallophosphoesterase [Telmatospirillum sp.]|uniref:metallophosphoesterase n=1 Tax=Telmatospirillum sp. TaxID=2079197 RepID=UPI00284631C0|nr:metallophosphoesterase [Telmatospirillum sp.]MDR3439439.1 metallophosphoesterase [Telmatospirillum sp.]